MFSFLLQEVTRTLNELHVQFARFRVVSKDSKHMHQVGLSVLTFGK